MLESKGDHPQTGGRPDAEILSCTVDLASAEIFFGPAMHHPPNMRHELCDPMPSRPNNSSVTTMDVVTMRGHPERAISKFPRLCALPPHRRNDHQCPNHLTRYV